MIVYALYVSKRTSWQKNIHLNSKDIPFSSVIDHKSIDFPSGWGDTLPKWIKNAITQERFKINMKALKGEDMTSTYAEACVYLYTASLTHLMDHDWGQVY